jgi:hypothetical protein
MVAASRCTRLPAFGHREEMLSLIALPTPTLPHVGIQRAYLSRRPLICHAPGLEGEECPAPSLRATPGLGGRCVTTLLRALNLAM